MPEITSGKLCSRNIAGGVDEDVAGGRGMEVVFAFAAAPADAASLVTCELESWE